MPLTAGTRIGPYEIVGWLGAGGMGEVYRARDPRLGRDVAIKLIPATFTADRSRLHRFEQEARAAGQLNHPNILAVYDVGTHDGAPYIVSELLEGESLRSRLKGGALSRKAVDYARQIAEGLAAAHDKGIVHRDLKPDNLFVTHEGRIKILDFGIAKLTQPRDDAATSSGQPTETEAGTVVGTAGYMSPEQVRGEHVDVRSDIFSFGAVLYEMLAGHPAFIRATSADTMSAILKEDPPAPPSQVPPGLDRIVSRCLEKSREARFQSARDLAFGLEVLSDTAAAATRTAAVPWRWRTVVGVTIVVLSMTAAIASWLNRNTAQTAMEDLLARATFTPVTSSESSELDADISPDGRFIVFLSDRDGPYHAFLTQVGSTENVKDLTPAAGDQRNPGVLRSVGFSGNGSSIWISGRDNTSRLRLVPLVAGEPKAFLTELAVGVAWSRDGGRLVYFTREKGDPLSVADGSGGNPRQIFASENDDHNHFPSWSPDSEWIYFTHGIQASQEYDVWRIRPTGGPAEQMTHYHSEVRYVTPLNERTVLYVAPDVDMSGPWLWALDVDRRESHRISTGLEKYVSVAASANGRRLVASVVTNSTANLWSVPILDRMVEERDVTPYRLPPTRALAPRFGDTSLFFLSASGPGDGLFRRSQDGTVSEVWKGSDGALVEPAAVSPQGDRVAIVVRKEGRQHLMLVSANGATKQSLADGIDVRGTSSWSPDGKWIVTGGNDAKGPGLFKIPAAGGPPVPIHSGQAFDPVWAPDDSMIVYSGQQRTNAPLQAVRPDGTEVTLPEIRVPFGPGRRGRARFLPNGKGLVYVHGAIGTQEFWLFDPTAGTTHQIARLSGSAAMYSFDITPDSKSIVFDRVKDNTDIRLIDLPNR